jgi:hypothetical protein
MMDFQVSSTHTPLAKVPDHQHAAPENSGFPPGLGLPDPVLEFLDQRWSALGLVPEDGDTSFDPVIGQFVNATKTEME